MRAVLAAISVLALSACGGGTDPARRAEPAREAAAVLPAPRAGADRLGTRVEQAWLEAWIGEPVTIAPGPGRATLLRFWTDTCPYCVASLPALEELRQTYLARGLQTVAIYHPKPPHPVPNAQIAAAARERGYQGPLAVDLAWHALEHVWLTEGSRRDATSASFLLDGSGVVRFVSPGPIFHAPGEDHGMPSTYAGATRDYADLRRAIEALLAGP